MGAAARAERAKRRRSILGDGLRAETASSIICLVFVKFSRTCLRPTCLGERPAGHVLLIGRECACFRHVAAWTYGVGCRNQVLQAGTSTTEAERVECCPFKLRPIAWEILRTRVLLKSARLHLKKVIPRNQRTLGSVPILATPCLGLRFKSADSGSSINSAFS